MARGERPDITVDTVDEVPPHPGNVRKRSQFYSEIAKRAFDTAPQWVVLRGYKSGAIASQMKKGKYPAVDPADHEIEIRRNADGILWDLYIRYVGKIVEK